MSMYVLWAAIFPYTCIKEVIRQVFVGLCRSNSFRVAKHDNYRRKRRESGDVRALPGGLGCGGGGRQDSCENERHIRGEVESKSLPTGHLTHLTDEEWTPIGNLSPPPHPRQQSRHRRRHHTQHLPVCGGARDSWEDSKKGEQEVLVVLTKNELDKANKDTHHKLLPEDFRIKLWWLVTYVNKGGSNALESRESGSTPSTITPSGSSSDTDDDDDDDEEEGSDWDSDGHCPERYVGRYRLMSDCSAAHPNHYTMPEGPT
ncbi:uncharacterized protein LOC134764347 isoform X1 [Penaeus indicus]|uniref:uncharacterized protein LOC134764347 isoform X1 n=1 Tax=Penaeus indicus TaxID=29960 RepID=UPI00300D95A7